MQLNEISQNIQSRRNKIFLLMEEVRRLRIQQRLKVRRASVAVTAYCFLPGHRIHCQDNMA